jgi:hypothetical protein
MNIHPVVRQFNIASETASGSTRRVPDEPLPVIWARRAPTGFETASILILVPIGRCDIVKSAA